MKEPVSFSTRVEELYHILSEAEKRDLSRYLASSYFNRNERLFSLHQFLCSNKSDEAKYNKNSAWKFVFPKERYQEKKFRYLVSNLIAAVEEFIYTQQTSNCLKTHRLLLIILLRYYLV